jgi:hypothetical protein
MDQTLFIGVNCVVGGNSYEDSSRRSAKTIIVGNCTATYDNKGVKEIPNLLCHRVDASGDSC